jgi:hypothetical protein
VGKPGILYAPRPDATPEAELNALAACYRYVLFDSQAKRGDAHDLTNNTTTEHFGERTTEQTNRKRGSPT